MVTTLNGVSKKIAGNGVVAHSTDGAAESSLDGAAHDHNGRADRVDGDVGAARKPLKLSTVSHTLDAEIAERLRHFAFRERISESAVIEFSLRAFFDGKDDGELGKLLRDRGAGLRRKS